MRSPSSSDFADDDGGAAEILAEINITPLTDVFIVLLIIFMVVASSEVGRQATDGAEENEARTEDFTGKLAERAFEIQTPEGTGSAEIVKKDVVVSVHPDGTLF